jgi:hypothetical protein
MVALVVTRETLGWAYVQTLTSIYPQYYTAGNFSEEDDHREEASLTLLRALCGADLTVQALPIWAADGRVEEIATAVWYRYGQLPIEQFYNAICSGTPGTRSAGKRRTGNQGGPRRPRRGRPGHPARRPPPCLAVGRQAPRHRSQPIVYSSDRRLCRGARVAGSRGRGQNPNNRPDVAWRPAPKVRLGQDQGSDGR